MILPLITTPIKHPATQRLETNFISFYEEMSKIKQKKYQLFLVEALGIEPRSEEEPHPASTCLSHLLVLAVITPIGRIFTANLWVCLICRCHKYHQQTSPSSSRLTKTQRARFLETPLL